MKFVLNVATFNIRGMGDRLKQLNLEEDMKRYKIDILAIQETKVTEEKHETLCAGNKLILFNQEIDHQAANQYFQNYLFRIPMSAVANLILLSVNATARYGAYVYNCVL